MFRRRPQERFTVRARRVLTLAQEEAERRHQYFIEPEHVLIGLLQEDGGVAKHVLEKLDLKIESVQSSIDELTGTSPEKTGNRIDLSWQTEKLLYEAVNEARFFGHEFVGTEYLLLGLMRLRRCNAEKIMQRHNISYEQVKKLVSEGVMDYYASNPSAAQALNTSIPSSITVYTNQENIEVHNGYYGIHPTPLARLLSLIRQGFKKDNED